MEITELGLLAVKTETTYGTDAVPDGTNAIPTTGDSIKYTLNATNVDRKANDMSLDRIAGYNAKPYVTLVFGYELRTSGVANTGAALPEIDPLLRAANLIVGLTAQSGGGGNGYSIYTSGSPGLPLLGTTSSVTCYWWTQTKLHKLIGGKASFKLTYKAGGIPVLEFTVVGKYSAVTDTSFPGSVSFVAAKPPLFDNAAVTLDGAYVPIFETVEFELGNKLVVRPSAASVDSIAGIVVGSRSPKLTLDPETDTVADYDFWGKYKASIPISISIGVGTVGGQKTLLTLPQMEIKKNSMDAREEVRTHKLEFQPQASSYNTNDIFSLKFF